MGIPLQLITLLVSLVLGSPLFFPVNQKRFLSMLAMTLPALGIMKQLTITACFLRVYPSSLSERAHPDSVCSPLRIRKVTKPGIVF